LLTTFEGINLQKRQLHIVSVSRAVYYIGLLSSPVLV